MTRKVEDQARWLADKFASQDKKIASLQTRGELAYSSIEDGSIVEKDLAGNLVASVGKQHDGSHVAVPYTGPTPAAPVAASLKAVPGVVEVRWSGKFTGDAVSAMDFKHVSIHVSTTPAVDATPSTQVATIRGELGDVATVTAVEGMLYVVLVAWSTAGKASAPSPVAAVAVPGAVDEAWIQGKLDDIDERYDGVITDAGNLGQRLSTAEVVLTSAQDRLTGAESDITDAFGQISTVDGKAGDAAAAASSAQGKADTAKSAADQAAADALAAAGIANSKGKTLIQSAAPAAPDRNSVTLWIDTTGGANTPKRWVSGTTWAAVTDKAATDAATAASAAAAAAATAKSAADAANAEIALIPAKIETAKQAAIDAAALVAQAKANAAEAAAKTAAATDAKTKADAAQAAAIAAAKTASDLSAAGAKSEAIAAATADAKTKADAAQAAAIAAAALDATAKAAQAKTDATTIAANDATTKANNAKADAIAAAALDATAKAGQAKTDAIASATTMTNGIGKNLSSTAVPTTFNTAPQGSMWRRTDSSGRIIGVWEQTGAGVAGTWTPRLITSETIDNLDVGKLSSSTAAISTLVSQKIAAAVGVFLALDVGQLTVTGSSTMAEAVINKLWTDVVNSRKITTQMLAVGSFDNLIAEPDFANEGVGWQLSAGKTIVAGEGRLGGAALRLVKSGAGATSIYAVPVETPIEGGNAYRLVAWVKPSVSAPAGSLTIVARTKTGAGVNAYPAGRGVNTTAVTAGQWARITGAITTADTAVSVAFFLEMTGAYPAGATADWDTVSVTRMNAGELTVDGTVTARALESELVLTTKVVAGDPAATHAEMSPLGFKVFASPAGGGTPTEVVRLGVAATDDFFAVSKASGELAATISQDGVIVGDQINATNGLWYKGNELTRLLDQLPRGLIGWAQRVTAAGANANNSQRFPYLRIKVEVTAGRAYKISTTPIQANASNTSTAAAIRLVYSLGADAVPFDNTLTVATTADEGVGGVWQSPITLSGVIYPQTSTTLSILIAFGAAGDGAVGIQASTSNPVGIFIEDVGPQVPQTGEALNGTATPPPTVQNHTRKYASTGSMNYQGSNAQYSWDTGNMYQGLSPAGMGNLKSISIHPSMTADLSGATINYVRVYFGFSHWYYNAGGTARIGLHGHAAIPGSFSGNGVVATVGGWPRPGARWVDLPASTFAGFKSGAYRGVYLEGDSTYGTYGIAGRPTLEIGYTK